MHVAQMDTQNFTFTALGENEQEAIAALARGWDKHAAWAEIEMTSNEAINEQYGVACYELVPGDCARECVPMGVAPAAPPEGGGA